MTGVQAKCGAIAKFDYMSQFPLGYKVFIHEDTCPVAKVRSGAKTCRHMELVEPREGSRFRRCPAVVIANDESKEDAS